MKTAYIAGKVSDLPKELYMRLFSQKQQELELKGYVVINPVALIVHHGLEDKPYKVIMRRCLGWMLKCDEVHLLHNWQESKGAHIEVETAQRVEMPIIYPN